MDFALVIYTHSDFLPLWDIIPYSLNRLKIELPVILLCDNKDLFKDLYNFKDILEYNNDTPYASRLLDCLPHINKNYILLMHENTILTHFCSEKILTIKKFVENSGLSRVHLSIDHSTIVMEHGRINKSIFNGNKIFLDNNIVLTNEHGYYHYSVGPSIWNKEHLYTILKQFPHKTYRDMEATNEIDDYMRVKGFHICYYGFNENDTIIKGSNRDMLNYFAYFHITGERKIIPRFLLQDLESTVIEYLEACNINVDNFFQLNFNK
jgi:hypothetical protein